MFSLLMNKPGLTVSIIFIILLLLHFNKASVFGNIAVPMKNQTSRFNDIRIAAVGDWGCKAATQSTANLISSKKPDLILGLGDFSYENDTGCWFKIMGPLISKIKIVIGEHDFDPKNVSRLRDYTNRFNLSNPYYSFNYGNVHFLAMSSLIPFNNESLPYKLLRDDSRQKQLSDDLYYASQNKSISWIVVYVYRPMYTSPTYHSSQEILRDSYQT